MPVSTLFLYSNSDSIPTIAIPFGILLLIMGVRVFHGIFTTPGSHNGCLEVIFTFVASIFLTALAGVFGGIMLFGINAYSPRLAWLAVIVFSAFCLFMHDYNKKKRAREREDSRRFHEAFQARHKDDLCRYCDAYRTGDGEVHHAPSCRNR